MNIISEQIGLMLTDHEIDMVLACLSRTQRILESEKFDNNDIIHCNAIASIETIREKCLAVVQVRNEIERKTVYISTASDDSEGN